MRGLCPKLPNVILLAEFPRKRIYMSNLKARNIDPKVTPRLLITLWPLRMLKAELCILG